MPTLVLFQPTDHPDVDVEALERHHSHVKRLQDQGHLHSCQAPSSDDSGGAVRRETHGYILLSSDREEVERLAEADPLWKLAAGNVQLIPWHSLSSTDNESRNHSIRENTLPQRRFDPIFPVSDLQRSLQHYSALGFETKAYDDEYGYATLPGVGCLHLSLQGEYDPKVSAAATYLHVDDADALAAEWRTKCPEADTREPVDTEYGLREGAHLDGDNNLIRFGSRIREND